MSDDEDDLEALRLQALASLKRNKENTSAKDSSSSGKDLSKHVSSETKISGTPVVASHPGHGYPYPTNPLSLTNPLPVLNVNIHVPPPGFTGPPPPIVPTSVPHTVGQQPVWHKGQYNNTSYQSNQGRWPSPQGQITGSKSRSNLVVLVGVEQKQDKQPNKTDVKLFNKGGDSDNSDSKPSTKPLLLRPQDKWALGLSDESSQSSLPSKPKDKFSRYEDSDSDDDSDDDTSSSDDSDEHDRHKSAERESHHERRFSRTESLEKPESDGENDSPEKKLCSEVSDSSTNMDRTLDETFSRSSSPEDYTGRGRTKRRRSNNSESVKSSRSSESNSSYKSKSASASRSSSSESSVSGHSRPHSRNSMQCQSQDKVRSRSNSLRDNSQDVNGKSSVLRTSSEQGLPLGVELKRQHSSSSHHSRRLSEHSLSPKSRSHDNRRSRTISTGNRKSRSSSDGNRQSRSPSYTKRSSRSPSYVKRRSRSPSYAKRRSRTPSYGKRRSRSPSYGKRRSRSPSYGKRSPTLSPRRLSPPSKRKSFSSRHSASRSPPKREFSPTNPLALYIGRPYKRKSLSPVRRSSKSPVRRSSRSPKRYRSKSPITMRRSKSRSPVRKRSLSPGERQSIKNRRSRSGSPYKYRSPARRHSLSPGRRWSRSPRRSRSPYGTQWSPAGDRALFRRYSRSPRRSRSWSRSPARGQRQSPMRGRSRSPGKISPGRRMILSPRGRSSDGKYRSPIRSSRNSPVRRSKSPMRRSSLSPLRRRSRSPMRRSPGNIRSRSPYRRNRTPPQKFSRSPDYRNRYFSNERNRNYSPVGSSHLSPNQRTRTFAVQNDYRPQDKYFSPPRRRLSPTPRQISPRRKSLSPLRSPKRRRQSPLSPGRGVLQSTAETSQGATLQRNSKPAIVQKLLKIAGQGSVPESVKSQSSERKNNGDTSEIKLKNVKVEKANSRDTSKDNVSEASRPAQSDPVLEARRKKFEIAAAVDPDQAPKKTISLKGIVPRTEKKKKKQKPSDEKKAKSDKSDTRKKEKNVTEQSLSKPLSGVDKKAHKSERTSSKITNTKRKSRDSVKSNRTDDFSESESDDASKLDDFSESESDSDEETWRNKKKAATERNRDDIEREKKQRLHHARKMERRRKEEEEAKRKEREEKSKGSEKVKYGEKEERGKSNREAHDSRRRDRRVKEHKHKKFVEIEGDDSDDEYRKGKSTKKLLTTVASSSRVSVSSRERNSPENTQKISKSEEGPMEKNTSSVKDRVVSPVKPLSQTDARHLIRGMRQQPANDMLTEEEEGVKDDGGRKRSPKVQITFDTGLSFKKVVESKKTSVHSRLGKVNPEKSSRMVIEESSGKSKKITLKRSVIDTDSQNLEQEDARLQIMQRKNQELIKRHKEIEKDREIHG